MHRSVERISSYRLACYGNKTGGRSSGPFRRCTKGVVAGSDQGKVTYLPGADGTNMMHKGSDHVGLPSNITQTSRNWLCKVFEILPCIETWLVVHSPRILDMYIIST